MTEDNLSSWRLRERLTIHEASCLAFNIDPSNLSTQPDGWEGFYSALTEAIKQAFKTEYSGGKPKFFPSSKVDNYHYCHTDEGDITKARIKVKAIKKWLSSKEFKPPFFFPESLDESKSDVFMAELKRLASFIEQPSTVKSIESENKSLIFLQKREWLTIHEIACIVCERDIQIFYTSCVDEALVMQESGQAVCVGLPSDGYGDFFVLLSEAINSNLETEFLNEQSIQKLLLDGGFDPQELIDQHIEENDALIFKVGLVKGAFSATVKDYKTDQALDINEAKIKVTALKEWLSRSAIRSSFFFPNEGASTRTNHKMPTNTSSNLSTQGKREKALENLIAERGLDVLMLKRRQGVWSELASLHSRLFPPCSENTIKKFFDNQSLIKFPRGRQ